VSEVRLGITASCSLQRYTLEMQQTIQKIKEIGFWTLSICLRPQVKGKKRENPPILLGPLERANLNHWPSLRNAVYLVY
jgi:hypothetical protein